MQDSVHAVVAAAAEEEEVDSVGVVAAAAEEAADLEAAVDAVAAAIAVDVEDSVVAVEEVVAVVVAAAAVVPSEDVAAAVVAVAAAVEAVVAAEEDVVVVLAASRAARPSLSSRIVTRECSLPAERRTLWSPGTLYLDPKSTARSASPLRFVVLFFIHLPSLFLAYDEVVQGYRTWHHVAMSILGGHLWLCALQVHVKQSRSSKGCLE